MNNQKQQGIDFMKKIKTTSRNFPISRALKLSCTFGPMLLGLFPEMALAVDLDAGGKAFFEPVVAFARAYLPVAIFIGGTLGLVVTPGADLKTKGLAAGGGMAVAGLIIKAAEKALKIA